MLYITLEFVMIAQGETENNLLNKNILFIFMQLFKD